MVDFIGVSRIRELLARRGTAGFIEELAAEIEADFLRWDSFDKSPRHASHSSVGVIELMPASDGRLYAFKYVNGHPKNTQAGLLTVTAFGVLADVQTGYPLLLSELTLTTALRTAATSALAARRMARAGSRVMALIGNGAQGEFQVIAFHRLLGVREVRLYDTDPGATEKLERNLARLHLPGLAVVRCPSTAEAVAGADIITTATADKRNATILTPELIVPGVHLNAVGGDCPGKTELHREILLRPDVRVVVEYEPQSRIEGEIQQMDASYAVTELAAVLAGRAPPRVSDREVTVFDSVGFALEDFSSLRYLLRIHHEERGPRTQIDLLPELEDPKDLFGLLSLRPRLAPTDALRARELEVVDLGNLSGPGNPWQPPRGGYRHLPEVVRWNELVHESVYRELQQGRLPILLGGDHCLSIGSIGAIARHCREQGRKLRVLWLDAHADFNTSELSPSGNVHGMPVACLCGFGPSELIGVGGRIPAIDPSWVRQIGVRSVDAGEKRFVHEQGLDVFDMRHVDEMGMRETMEQALRGIDGDTHLHVSFDVDFLDPEIAPGVGTRVPGGPTYREAQLCMEMIADTHRLASLDVVELNPAFDVHNRTATLAVDLIESLFGKRTLVRRPVWEGPTKAGSSSASTASRLRPDARFSAA